MTRPLLSLLVFVLMGTSTFATHLMGGEITVKNTAPGEYVVRLAVYRDTLGIDASLTQFYDLKDDLGNVIAANIMDMDVANSGTPLPGYPYGVEPYVYYDTITGLNTPGSYTIEWSQCCRNAAILNMIDPDSESMWLTTDFEVYANTSNSSPVFLAPPVIYLPVNVPWQYNPIPFDSDGDSIAWAIDVPLSSGGVPVAGYTPPSSAVSGPFSVDPVTGIVSWTADQLGNFVASFLVEEYRNGVKIGEIRRDMQYIVVQSQSSMPMFTNMNALPQNTSGYPQLDLVAGQPFQFTFLGADADVNDVLYMYAYGGMFEVANSPATFTTNFGSTGTNSIEGNFAWTPDASTINQSPYLLGLRILDGLFAFDETVLVTVDLSSGIETPKQVSLTNVFPNPSSGHLNLSFYLPSSSQTAVVITDMQGREVESFSRSLNAGNHLLTFQPQVSAGTYLLQIRTENGATSVQKVILR